QGLPGGLLLRRLPVSGSGEDKGGVGHGGAGDLEGVRFTALGDVVDPDGGVGDPDVGVGVAHGRAEAGDAVGDVGGVHAPNLGAEAVSLDVGVARVEVGGEFGQYRGQFRSDRHLQFDALAGADGAAAQDEPTGHAQPEQDREGGGEG